MDRVWSGQTTKPRTAPLRLLVQVACFLCVLTFTIHSEGQSAAAELAVDEGTVEAATELMKAAVTVQVDGRHHGMLRALRHRRDPDLRPWFEALSRPGNHPSLRVHALLGLAEIEPPASLTVEGICRTEPASVRSALVTAALESQLLDADVIRNLVNRPELDRSSRLLLAMSMVAGGELDDKENHDLLLSSLASTPPGQRGLAALLLTQLGDDRGEATLTALLAESDHTSDPLVVDLLDTAWSLGFEAASGWAMQLATDAGTPKRAAALALKIAVRSGDERADALWTDRLETSESAERLEWAWLGLELAPWLSPERFTLLRDSDDPLLAAIGDTAEAVSISRKNEALRTAMVPRAGVLLATQHPVAWRWAADYASQTGSASLAAEILDRYRDGDLRGRARRLEAVASAADTLARLDPPTATRLIRGKLLIEDADPAWRDAVLLGLIRCQSDAARDLADRLPAFEDRSTAALVLMLRLQRPASLDEREQTLLSWIIQDPASLDDSLRVQAAWAYLKSSARASRALTQLLATPGGGVETPH